MELLKGCGLSFFDYYNIATDQEVKWLDQTIKLAFMDKAVIKHDQNSWSSLQIEMQSWAYSGNYALHSKALWHINFSTWWRTKTNLSNNTKPTAIRVMINGGVTSHILDISSNGHFLFNNGGFRGACLTLSRSELDWSFEALDLALPPCQRIIIIISQRVLVFTLPCPSLRLRCHVGVGGREQAAWCVLFRINVLGAAGRSYRMVSSSRWTLA